MLTQNDIIGASMQAAVYRDEIITNNIANADVPGFKKKTVNFEEYLAKAVSDYKKTNKLDLSQAIPSVVTEHSGYGFRVDENNVDMQTEMVDLYQNSLKYDSLAGSLMSNYKRLNLVLSIK